MAVIRTFNHRVKAQKGKVGAEGDGLDVKLELDVESAEEYGANGSGASEVSMISADSHNFFSLRRTLLGSLVARPSRLSQNCILWQLSYCPWFFQTLT